MVFCNKYTDKILANCSIVTILILIDGFLQYYKIPYKYFNGKSHNPYFNRWFSAMRIDNDKIKSFNGSQSLF